MENLDKSRLAAAAEALVNDIPKIKTVEPWELIHREVQHFTNDQGEKFTMFVSVRKFDDRPAYVIED